MGADAVDVTEVTGIDLPESSLPPGDGSRSMTQEFDQAVDKGIDKAASEDVRQTITPKDPETALDKSMDQAAPEHAHCPATTTIEPGTALDKSMDKAALEHTHRPSTTHLDRETARDEDVSSKASASLDNPKRVPDVPVSAQDFISRLPEELRDLMFNFVSNISSLMTLPILTYVVARRGRCAQDVYDVSNMPRFWPPSVLAGCQAGSEQEG